MNKISRMTPVFMMLLMLIIPLAQAQDSVVYGVFFYSPTCPHCHEVMSNHWPDIEARFGEQLKVLFVDVTTVDGSNLMKAAYDVGIIKSGSVPQLIIGETVLVGSVAIPRDAPTLIEQGLASGGIGYPNIPDIDTWFQEAGMGEFSLNIKARSLSADPANYVAIGVLIFLILSLLLITLAVWRVLGQNNAQLLTRLTTQFGWWILLITSLTGFSLALTLLFGSSEFVVIALSSLIALIFIGSVAMIGNKPTLREIPEWLVPLTLIAGIIAAAYLSYVEFTLSDAVCGAMGDCNVVQQSDYAYIGNIPIGFIGVAAYTTMLLIWLIGRGEYKQFANSILLILTVFGVMFSIYLTFLEPFVIGATCVWCLLSATTMLSLLWLIVPTVFEGFLSPQHHESYKKAKVPST